MKTILSTLLVLALAVTAFAGTNPNIHAYLTVNATGEAVNYICPTPYTQFSAYVCLDNLGVGGGVRGMALKLDRTFGAFVTGSANLLGGLTIGAPEVDWSIVAGENCAMPNGAGIVLAGRVDYLYTGTPGTLILNGHPQLLNKTLDCFNAADWFCVHITDPQMPHPTISGNLGVCVPAPEPVVYACEQASPVEDSTWGTIKSLYR